MALIFVALMGIFNLMLAIDDGWDILNIAVGLMCYTVWMENKR